MEKYSEKIQDYIEGLLAGEELGDFERQLENDNELRTLVKLQQEVHLILNKRVNSKEVELRHVLREVEEQHRFGAVRNVFDYKKYLTIAAVLCAVLLGGLFLFKNDASLYDLPVLQSEIVRGEQPVHKFETAVTDFNQGNFKDAIVLFEELVSAEPNLDQYQYYLGLSYLGDENLKESIMNLKTVSLGTSIFADEAKFYLAVAYVKNNETDKAIVTLKSITQLSEKAEKLLKKLD